MTTRLFRLATATLFLTTASLLRAAIAPAENLLPADTIAFFTVPDATVFRTTAKQSPNWMFWEDPAMKPFHDKFMAKVNERFIAPIEQDLGLKVNDFLNLLQGQLTVAVTVNGSKGHDDIPAGGILLLDTKGKSDLLKTNLALLTTKWKDAGRALRTEKIHGLTFTVVPLSTNDLASLFPKRAPVLELGKEPKPEQPGEIYFTQFESLLVVANASTVAEIVAAHLTGGSAPALAEDAAFAADKPAQFRDAPVYYGWFGGKTFFNLLAQSPETTDDGENPFGAKFSPVKILEATGLGGLKSASFAMRESREGAALSMHITAPEAGRAGLLKMLALPAKDASVPSFVPADAVKFSRVRLDGKQTWAELQKMVTAISPQGLASLNAVIDLANTFGQQKNPGFDLRTALIGNLGDDIISYQKPVTSDSLAALSSPPTLFLVAVANADETIAAIKTVAAMGAQQDASKPPREFLGRKIHSIALRGKGQPPLLLSASGGYLALSADASTLEEYLRSADGKLKPLRENASLAEAMQRVGGAGGGLFGYENQRETMRVTFRAFKNASESANATKLLPAAVRDWVDFALLPEYEKVQKYFYVSVFSGSANADGLTLKVFTPRPPQLN